MIRIILALLKLLISIFEIMHELISYLMLVKTEIRFQDNNSQQLIHFQNLAKPFWIL